MNSRFAHSLRSFVKLLFLPLENKISYLRPPFNDFCVFTDVQIEPMMY